MRLLVPMALSCLLWSPMAFAKEKLPTADATTQALLRRAEFEQVRISPDGTMFAIARRMPTGTVVTIHRRDTMEPLTSIDPGKNGEVDTLRWLDNRRLLVGANRANGLYGMAMVEPALFVVPVDGKDVIKLPANFVAEIEGDPDHLLVSRCGSSKEESGCLPEIRKADINKLRRIGELVTSAPATHSRMYVDRKGNARFALRVEDDGSTRTYVRDVEHGAWTLVNDSEKTGLDLVPLAVSDDNRFCFLQSERVDGPDAIEAYEFATGQRKVIYQDPASDPVSLVYAITGEEPIGAIYDATRPTIRLWNAAHPDAIVIAQLQKAFPGRLARVVSASDDGMAMVVETVSDRDPGTFYAFDRRTNTAKALTRSMPWLDGIALGTQRAVRLQARDGTPLHGVLTLPPGSAGKSLPTVVLVHGGPYGVLDTWGFDPEVQILATHGFAVLQVNFRGSGGYGRTFMDKGMREWGRAMQDDVTDATRWAIDEGIADPARICLYGGSYGGYAALMGVAREPELYRCAAAFAGVFDLAKMYKWGDIRRHDLGLGYLKRALGEDKADLASRSPSKLADRIRVPVLLAHGRLDARVDVRHAREMEDALDDLDRPVELVEYPYAGHALVLDDQRLDFYARLLAFLGRNLGETSNATAAN